MIRKKTGIWLFFSSVNLTIVLLAIIALVSIAGTFVPQREAAEEVARQIGPGLFSFLQALQVFDLYHSIWFFLLMGLLLLNLIVCSANRFPHAMRHFRAESDAVNFDIFEDISQDAIVCTAKDKKVAAQIAASVIKGRFSNVQSREKEDGLFFHGDKGRFSYFGVYVVHLSILFLIAGAVIGSIFGIEGYVNISEGETVNTIEVRGEDQILTLPFSVRCDKFTMELYENGAPKTYRSELTFLKDEQIAFQGELLVNHPLNFEGFRFYQSSFGSTSEGKAAITVFKNGTKSQDILVIAGDTFKLPGGEGVARVLRAEADLMNMGPAVKLSIASPKGETVFWVFRNIDKIVQINPGIMRQIPMFNPGLFRPYVFALNGMQEKYYTGLQVRRDQGLPLVAAAAFLMIAGLMLVFFSSHRLVWLRVDAHNGCSRISIAGRSNKDAAGLKREMKTILDLIRKKLESLP